MKHRTHDLQKDGRLHIRNERPDVYKRQHAVLGCKHKLHAVHVVRQGDPYEQAALRHGVGDVLREVLVTQAKHKLRPLAVDSLQPLSLIHI